MENEILEIVRQNSENTDRLLTLIFFGVLIWILKNVLGVWNNISAIMKQQWGVMASDLFRSGKYEKLLKESKKLIKKEPKNSTGLFWKARAEKELKQLANAKETLSELLDIEPNWKQDWMDELLTPNPRSQTSTPQGANQAGDGQ
jgi:tetratricopeptide (TPR) repeat protein